MATIPRMQEQEQATVHGSPRFITCLEATPNALWAGTMAGLHLFRELRAPSATFLPNEHITTVIAPTATVYFGTMRSWGVYRISPSGGLERIEPPEVTHAGYVQVRALALWNNTLAIATSFGLYSYSSSPKQWELVYPEPTVNYLLATGARLWAFGNGIVAFDRAYRVVEQADVSVPIAPVREQARFWWATASHTGVALCSFAPTTRAVRSTNFRFEEEVQVVSAQAQATAICRHGAFWYVGLKAIGSGRSRGAVVRLDFTTSRARLVWHGSAVSALASWRNRLMIGTENGLYALNPA